MLGGTKQRTHHIIKTAKAHRSKVCWEGKGIFYKKKVLLQYAGGRPGHKGNKGLLGANEEGREIEER